MSVHEAVTTATETPEQNRKRLRKVAAGVTSLDEVLRATQDQGE